MYLARMLLALAFTCWAAGSAMACNIVVGSTTFNVTSPASGIYNPTAAQVIVTFNVTVQNNTGAKATCEFGFTTPTGTAAMTALGSPNTLSMELNKNGTNATMIDATGSTAHTQKAVNLAVGASVVFRVDFIIAAGQFVASGDYSATVTGFLLRDSVQVETRPFYFNTRVPSLGAIFVSVAGPATVNSGKTAYLNFGRLTEGETGSIYFLVQSTGSYRLRVSSANGGRLQMLNPPAIPVAGFQSFVDYTLTFNGQTIDANVVTSLPTALPLPGTPTAGTGHVFTVTIENGPQLLPGDFIEGKLAGRYEDVVTFSLVAE